MDSPFWAIRLFPRAGKPTMTTQMRVSSACTPTPLVMALELPLVLVAGRIKSPCGVRIRLDLYWSGCCWEAPSAGEGTSSTAGDMLRGLDSRRRDGGRW